MAALACRQIKQRYYKNGGEFVHFNHRRITATSDYSSPPDLSTSLFSEKTPSPPTDQHCTDSAMDAERHTNSHTIEERKTLSLPTNQHCTDSAMDAERHANSHTIEERKTLSLPTDQHRTDSAMDAEKPPDYTGVRKQAKMREHLYESFLSGKLQTFPTLRERRCATRVKIKDDIQVFCACRIPELPGVEMVECCRCKEWYHVPCIQVPHVTGSTGGQESCLVLW